MGGAITSLIGIAITFLFLRVASDHNEFLELAFAARAMSEGALNSAAPFRFAFLSAFSVPRSEHPRPSDARSPIRNPLCAFEGVDSFPQASCGPLPQMSSSRLGSGSRRHTLRASMYRRQRTNQKKRSQTHVQQSHPHRPPRILKRVFCSVAPQYPNSGESNRLTSQNSCSWSGFLSRPIWRTPLACHHYAARAVTRPSP